MYVCPFPSPLCPLRYPPSPFCRSRGHVYIYPYALLSIFQACYLFTLLSHYSSPAPTRPDTLWGNLKQSNPSGLFPAWWTSGPLSATKMKSHLSLKSQVGSIIYRLTGVPSTGALNGGGCSWLSRFARTGYPHGKMKSDIPTERNSFSSSVSLRGTEYDLSYISSDRFR